MWDRQPNADRNASDPAEGTLVERARDGDRRAFERLTGLYQARIFRMVYIRTQSRTDAEDLTQDIFLQAFRSVSKLKAPDLFRPWLFRIAHNRVRDHHRRRRIVSFFGLSRQDEEIATAGEPPAEQEDALADLMRKEFWGEVESFLGNLPASEREVFRLRFLDQLGIREAAEVLGKHESTVKTHLYRAIAKFRKEPWLARLLFEEKPT